MAAKRRPVPIRSSSGRLVSPRSYWCSRGGLVTVVSARTHAEARAEAGRRFRTGFRWRRDDSLISVRKASRSDVDRWHLLLEQQAAGVEGARVGSPEPSTQEALFDVA